MATQTLTRPQQDQTVEEKIQQLRQLYADAPQFAKTALENTLTRLDVGGVGAAIIGWKAPAGPASVRARSRS